MPRLPAVSGRALVSALGRAGFQVVRQRGSHVQVAKEFPDGRRVTFPVPVHATRTLKTGTLRGILRLACLTPDEFQELL